MLFTPVTGNGAAASLSDGMEATCAAAPPAVVNSRQAVSATATAARVRKRASSVHEA